MPLRRPGKVAAVRPSICPQPGSSRGGTPAAASKGTEMRLSNVSGGEMGGGVARREGAVQKQDLQTTLDEQQRARTIMSSFGTWKWTKASSEEGEVGKCGT